MALEGAWLSAHGARVVRFLPFLLPVVMDVVSATAEVDHIPVAALLVA